MKKRHKKREQEPENEVTGYDQGREVEFAGDLEAGPEEQAQPGPQEPLNEEQ